MPSISVRFSLFFFINFQSQSLYFNRISFYIILFILNIPMDYSFLKLVIYRIKVNEYFLVDQQNKKMHPIEEILVQDQIRHCQHSFREQSMVQVDKLSHKVINITQQALQKFISHQYIIPYNPNQSQPQLKMSSDVRSNSSYAMSAIQFNSKSLNPLDSINPALISKIKRQADNFVGCANKCTQIWNALAKNDIAGEHLSEKVLQTIFKEYQSDLYTFTKIGSLREFMRIFDVDKDGSLNSDEQIGIFSFIKQKIEIAASNCLQTQLYIKFEQLMKEVRIMEQNISKWQGKLRQKIHSGQLQMYYKEGENRVDEFCDRYDREFEQLQKTKLERRETFEKQAFYQQQLLEERLSQPNEYLKIKPTNRLRELQIQQKLVSLQERVYEALDFRRELSELEVKQRDRVDRLMIEHANHQRQNLKNKHAKQRRQLEIKLEEMENKLIIKMKKQFEILRKRNGLHEIEIKRLQGIQKKWAHKKALFEPELKRNKKLEKQRNQVLEEYKKSMFTASKVQDPIEDESSALNQGTTTSKFNAKSLLNATIKFRLTNRSTNDIPVNAKQIKPEGNMGAKIGKYIAPRMTGKAYSLCKMYDGNLEELKVPAIESQSQKLKEKTRKLNFIMEKLSK